MMTASLCSSAILVLLLLPVESASEHHGNGEKLIRFEDIRRDDRVGRRKCLETINSLKKKEGTVQSHGYPAGYRPGIACNYHFIGLSNERIQLFFRDIDLKAGDTEEGSDQIVVITSVAKNTQTTWKPQSPASSSSSSSFTPTTTTTTTTPEKNSWNATTASDSADNQLLRQLHLLLDEDKYSVLKVYRGNVRSPALMSAGEHLVVVMMTRLQVGPPSNHPHPPHDHHLHHPIEAEETSAVEKTAAGFKADFKFVTDFGINVGEQVQSKDCIFRLNSSTNSRGTFHSPNHPGLYPRSTDCHFLFRRSRDETLTIKFLFLDVDGIPPLCSNESESDFVEIFSGFHDLRIRICTSHPEANIPATRRAYKFGPEIEDRPDIEGHFEKGRGRGQPDGAPDDVVSVSFHSNAKYDGEGFLAEYRFQKSIGQHAPNAPSLIAMATPLLFFFSLKI